MACLCLRICPSNFIVHTHLCTWCCYSFWVHKQGIYTCIIKHDRVWVCCLLRFSIAYVCRWKFHFWTLSRTPVVEMVYLTSVVVTPFSLIPHVSWWLHCTQDCHLCNYCLCCNYICLLQRVRCFKDVQASVYEKYFFLKWIPGSSNDCGMHVNTNSRVGHTFWVRLVLFNGWLSTEWMQRMWLHAA